MITELETKIQNEIFQLMKDKRKGGHTARPKISRLVKELRRIKNTNINYHNGKVFTSIKSRA